MQTIRLLNIIEKLYSYVQLSLCEGNFNLPYNDIGKKNKVVDISQINFFCTYMGFTAL
jgi:hypothetical protein